MLNPDIRIYQVIQKNEWSCPGMIIWVNSQGVILATQTNPENGLTYVGVNADAPDQCFNALEYAYVELVRGDKFKTAVELQESYRVWKKKYNIE